VGSADDDGRLDDDSGFGGSGEPGSGSLSSPQMCQNDGRGVGQHNTLDPVNNGRCGWYMGGCLFWGRLKMGFFWRAIIPLCTEFWLVGI